MPRRFKRTPRRGGRANSAPPEGPPPQPPSVEREGSVSVYGPPPHQDDQEQMPVQDADFRMLMANMHQQSRQLHYMTRRLRKMKFRYYKLKRLLKEFAENVAATLSSDDEE